MKKDTNGKPLLTHEPKEEDVRSALERLSSLAKMILPVHTLPLLRNGIRIKIILFTQRMSRPKVINVFGGCASEAMNIRHRSLNALASTLAVRIARVSAH